MILIGLLIFLTIYEGKYFLNYFGFWSFKFFVTTEIFSFANSQFFKKQADKRRLVNKWKNADTKINPMPIFWHQNLPFFRIEIIWFTWKLFENYSHSKGILDTKVSNSNEIY